MFEFALLLSVYRTSKTPEPQRLISRSAHKPDERSGIRGQSYHEASLMRATQPTFDFNNLISRAIIVIAGRRHEL